MGLPTIHNPTNPILYICRRDTTWDRERINYEVVDGDREPDDDHPAVPWDNTSDHPIIRYQLGKTRYDLTTVEQYLNTNALDPPTKFHLRRLSRSQRNNLPASRPAARSSTPSRPPSAWASSSSPASPA